MNTLANHGYINRTGITTVAETLVGGSRLFNMGVDLIAFLAGGSVIFAGDIPSMKYSIGGADVRTNSLGVIGGALGTETGLSGHLRFKEGDASGTREDFYLTNGNTRPSIAFINSLYYVHVLNNHQGTTTISTPASSPTYKASQSQSAAASTTSKP